MRVLERNAVNEGEKKPAGQEDKMALLGKVEQQGYTQAASVYVEVFIYSATDVKWESSLCFCLRSAQKLEKDGMDKFFLMEGVHIQWPLF